MAGVESGEEWGVKKVRGYSFLMNRAQPCADGRWSKAGTMQTKDRVQTAFRVIIRRLNQSNKSVSGRNQVSTKNDQNNGNKTINRKWTHTHTHTKPQMQPYAQSGVTNCLTGSHLFYSTGQLKSDPKDAQKRCVRTAWAGWRRLWCCPQPNKQSEAAANTRAGGKQKVDCNRSDRTWGERNDCISTLRTLYRDCCRRCPRSQWKDLDRRKLTRDLNENPNQPNQLHLCWSQSTTKRQKQRGCRLNEKYMSPNQTHLRATSLIPGSLVRPYTDRKMETFFSRRTCMYTKCATKKKQLYTNGNCNNLCVRVCLVGEEESFEDNEMFERFECEKRKRPQDRRARRCQIRMIDCRDKWTRMIIEKSDWTTLNCETIQNDCFAGGLGNR